MLDLHHPDLQPGHIELCGRIATSAHKGLTEIRATKFAQEEAWRFLQREQHGDREDREDREEDQEDRNGKEGPQSGGPLSAWPPFSPGP